MSLSAGTQPSLGPATRSPTSDPQQRIASASGSQQAIASGSHQAVPPSCSLNATIGQLIDKLNRSNQSSNASDPLREALIDVYKILQEAEPHLLAKILNNHRKNSLSAIIQPYIEDAILLCIGTHADGPQNLSAMIARYKDITSSQLPHVTNSFLENTIIDAIDRVKNAAMTPLSIGGNAFILLLVVAKAKASRERWTKSIPAQSAEVPPTELYKTLDDKAGHISIDQLVDNREALVKRMLDNPDETEGILKKFFRSASKNRIIKVLCLLSPNVKASSQYTQAVNDSAARCAGGNRTALVDLSVTAPVVTREQLVGFVNELRGDEQRSLLREILSNPVATATLQQTLEQALSNTSLDEGTANPSSGNPSPEGDNALPLKKRKLHLTL